MGIYDFYKLSGLKYDLYCQGYVHYSNGRYTQKTTYLLACFLPSLLPSFNTDQH